MKKCMHTRYYKYDGGSTPVTRQEREEWIARAESKCQICKRYTDQPNLDHCHKTGKIRGILCYSCNTALGKFQDDAEVLQAAIDYLKSA